MKAIHCIALNMLGAGICVGFALCVLDKARDLHQYHVSAFHGAGMTAGLCIALAGVLSLFLVEPEVWG